MMTSIMDVLLPAVVVLFVLWVDCLGAWALCDFNQAYFYLSCVNMHGTGRGGRREMSKEKMNESN